MNRKKIIPGALLALLLPVLCCLTSCGGGTGGSVRDTTQVKVANGTGGSVRDTTQLKIAKGTGGSVRDTTSAAIKSKHP